ncbi:uncharacterized protein LOC128159197 [Crassostrea angulata]|uniref:uncharacterized protein LOC128159197 n=1 Tax=Magallana angulata TaxID=2784310 RepID=UPI0022B0B2B1|nr:uncharacterized protein LOC128159197 [Crassostrea angulata]
MAYSVFVSEKGMPDVICNDSNANCYHKEEQVKFLLTDETECNSAYDHYRDTCFIELTTQIYTSFDRGKKLSKNDQRNILFCEQCTEQGCLFANCKSQLNTMYCTKNVLSTAHPSVLKTITQTVIPNVTEKRVRLRRITYNKLVSIYKKQTLSHGAIFSRTTQSISKEDTITSKC